MESLIKAMSTYLTLITKRIMEYLIKAMVKSTLNRETCSYRNCSCHRSRNTLNISLKACAACGISSYCCKQSQTSDWCRHKKLCRSFRRFKDTAKHLTNPQKLSLNSISFDLPALVEEYRNKYGSGHETTTHCMYITGALIAVKDMVSNNIANMTAKSERGDDLKRWQEISPELFNFIEHAEPGDVFLKKKYHSYSPRAPQQFRNTPLSEPAVLQNGTSVVDIGFVDFGIAFDSIDSIKFEGNPVRVFGYEKEPLCVAKSMIMMEMMKENDVTPRSVVEVWLSSLWSKTTFQAFKKATRTILRKDEHRNEIENKVKPIIQYWSQKQQMNAKAALQFQMSAMIKNCVSDFAMNSCSLELEEDRVRYLRYNLTKALYEDKSTTVGSVVMNHVNEQIGVTQSYEDCFEAAPARIHMSMEPSFVNSSVVDRTVSYFEKQMEKFIRHVRNGTLVFTPKLGIIAGNNHAIIEEIRAKKASTISWSNVIDYIEPTEFHKLSKRMSCENTAHYLHSCNWSSRVYGTDIMDLNEQCRLQFYSSGLCTIEQGLAFLHGFTKQGCYHFRDSCSTVLGRRYCNQFFRYFFAGQDVKCACLNGQTPLKHAFPFARNVSTAFIIYAYTDAGFDFGSDTYDFNSNY